MTARGKSMKGVMFTVFGLLSLCGSAGAEESWTIPLDHIWAYKMPGTRDIRKLEPKRPTGNLSVEELIRTSLVLQISDALGQRPKQGEKAGPAIVVLGTGKEALQNAHSIFTKRAKKEPPRLMPLNRDLSLFFYAFIGGRYVQIVSAEVSGSLITVQYRLVSHLTADATTHFALIPLGRFPEGLVQVEIEQVSPMDANGQVMPIRDERHIVCDSFSFAVEK